MPNSGHKHARRAWALATACMVLTAAATPARAGPPKPIDNPTPKDMARAKELYDNGRGLYQEGSYEGAAFAFEEAYKLSGDINVLYNVSLAYDRAGDFEKALRFLEYYRALAPESERAALTQKVESLKIRLEKQKEAEAEAEGSGDTGDEPDEPDPPEPPITTPENVDSDDTVELPKVFTPVVGVLFGVGALGFGLGIGFGASSLSRTRAAEDGCSGGLCDAQTQDDLDKARNRALVADISIGVGAAATVTAAALLIANVVRRKKAKAATTARLRPTWGGLQVRF